MQCEGAEFAYFCRDLPRCTCSSGLTRDVCVLHRLHHLLPCALLLQPDLAASLLLQVEQMSPSCFASSPAAVCFYFGSCWLSGKKRNPAFGRFNQGISLVSRTAQC